MKWQNYLAQTLFNWYRNDDLIPTIKIINKFVQELSRAQEYIPYLIDYQNKIRVHIRYFGDADNSYRLKFGLDEIY